MASAFGWYGPLIDLGAASSHVGDFVQLLVFVHRSFPVPCKSSKRGDVMRTDIQVGDDTTPYFGVALWQKLMGSKVVAGDVIFLQNVKIAKYADVIEARTVQWSSLCCLVHPYESLISKGVDELITGCRVGKTAKDKLRRVIKWVQQSRSTFCNIKFQSDKQLEYLPRNWKVHEERMPQNCFSLLEVSQLTMSCKAVVCAYIGEMIPLTPTSLGDTKQEKIFISRRFNKTEDKNLVEDLLCIGCQLCGSPLNSESEKNASPLICSKSSSRLHSVCTIYRPFMLYVWDESDYMPVLVKNSAAVILFGNIKAEKVHSSYLEQMLNHKTPPTDKCKDKDAVETHTKLSGEGFLEKFNFYDVWLIFLKMLLQQGNNSSLKFEIIVDPSLNVENGRFEMVSVTMPCFGLK